MIVHNVCTSFFSWIGWTEWCRSICSLPVFSQKLLQVLFSVFASTVAVGKNARQMVLTWNIQSFIHCDGFFRCHVLCSVHRISKKISKAFPSLDQRLVSWCSRCNFMKNISGLALSEEHQVSDVFWCTRKSCQVKNLDDRSCFPKECTDSGKETSVLDLIDNSGIVFWKCCRILFCTW